MQEGVRFSSFTLNVAITCQRNYLKTFKVIVTFEAAGRWFPFVVELHFTRVSRICLLVAVRLK